MNKPTLYIFSGLPAVGKSTLAQKLAGEKNFTFVRIDTVEQGLKDICKIDSVEGEGYRLSYRIVKDNLKLGNNVIADSVNPWELSRKQWNQVAIEADANFVNIEIICSDLFEHRDRVENRKVGIDNLTLPTWEEVVNRDYHKWMAPRIVIDTSGKKVEQSFDDLLIELKL